MLQTSGADNINGIEFDNIGRLVKILGPAGKNLTGILDFILAANGANAQIDYLKTNIRIVR